jgi:Legume lectin domain
MRLARVVKAVLIGTTTLLWMASASAQQIRFFPDFSSVANLHMNGTHQKTWNGQKVLGLTDGYSGVGIFHPGSASAWFNIQQPVKSGFSVYFKFQIHAAGICCTPGDGLAFVIQNTSSTYPTDPTYGATGVGITAKGVGNGGVGYAGIRNSLAVEFDTMQNPAPNAWDPSANHIAVQSCGTNTNGPAHNNGPYTIGTNHNVNSCLVKTAISSSIPHLGVTCDANSCLDGVTHEAAIEYTPPAPNAANGTLQVWIDPTFAMGTHTPTSTPALSIAYNIDGSQNASTGLALAGGTSAWVGFTAAQTSMPQANDIIAWEFTPHTPTKVQQTIPPGGTGNTFQFGGHDTIVTYFPGFTNNGCDGISPSDPCLMTVVATPTARADFDRFRLAGTPFSNEHCIVYQDTGGKCIVYSITCQKTSNPTQNVACPASIPGTCNQIGDPGCIQFSTSFYTLDPVTTTNADYLKADPIGSNNWQSIFQFFDPNVLDGRTGGTGNTPSDFVATFRPEEEATNGTHPSKP